MNVTLNSAQFACLWRATGTDILPYPLTHRATAETADEHVRDLQRLAGWLRVQEARYAPVVDTLRAAELTISVYADTADPVRSRLRILGAARGGDAVLVEQLPGREPEVGGDIRLFTGAADALAGSIMQALPHNRPGRGHALVAHQAQVRDPDNGNDIWQSATTTPAEAMRALLRRDRACTGHVRVTGSRTTHFVWIDVAGDGRYLVRGDEVLQVDPCSPERLYDAVRAAVDDDRADR